MAGLDRMYDICGFIQQYIEQKIRELLEAPMNEYHDPNWVQVALLFERVVIPCEEYNANGLSSHGELLIFYPLLYLPLGIFNIINSYLIFLIFIRNW